MLTETTKEKDNKMKQMNQIDAIHYIATRQEFKASALSGTFKDYTPSEGRLNGEEYSLLESAMNESKIAFVVFSYGTPIAWHTDARGWYVVAQKFSTTTSKHQNYTRRAIAESLQGAN